jgi:hypothetical protein
MHGLRLGISLTTVGRGVLVLQSDDYSPSSVRARLCDLLEGSGAHFTSFGALAGAWGISLTLATEYILDAERTGLVCRDDSLHGVRFFRTPASWRTGGAA